MTGDVDRPRVVEFFAGQTDVRFAYLFGSQARGEAGPLSDVDLAVALGCDPAGHAARRDDLNACLMQLLGRNDVDLVLADRAPPLLRHRIATGICLFARKPVEATRFAVAALRDYEDTCPLRAAFYAAQERRARDGELAIPPRYRRVDANVQD